MHCVTDGGTLFTKGGQFPLVHFVWGDNIHTIPSDTSSGQFLLVILVPRTKISMVKTVRPDLFTRTKIPVTVPLAVSFSGFYSGCRLICCTDWTVMLISSLLWGICSSLDSGLLATAVKVSKSCHNSTIKLLIQNSPISFQDNTALSLHCKF